MDATQHPARGETWQRRRAVVTRRNEGRHTEPPEQYCARVCDFYPPRNGSHGMVMYKRTDGHNRKTVPKGLAAFLRDFAKL